MSFNSIKKVACLGFSLFLLFTMVLPASALPPNYDSCNNLARGATVKTSSDYSSNFSGSLAVDETFCTRWNAASGTGAGEWIELDLSTTIGLNRIVINEYLDRVTSYVVYIAQYSVGYVELLRGTTMGDSKTLRFQSRAVKKIKIQITGTKYDSNGWGKEPSIKEIRLYSDSNIAKTATVTASSEYNSCYKASFANDENDNTGWSSAPCRGSGEWLQVDFGTRKSFNRITLKQPSNRISGFNLEYYDGAEWKSLFKAPARSDFILWLHPVIAQKVRVVFSNLDPSITEFGIYADNDSLIATPSASSEYSSSYSASKANDGDAVNTRWNAAPGKGVGEWLEVDFGRYHNVNGVIIDEFLDRITSFKIQYYSNGTWIDSISGTTIGTEKVIYIRQAYTNKIRLLITGTKIDSKGYGSEPSIYEFETFAI